MGFNEADLVLSDRRWLSFNRLSFLPVVVVVLLSCVIALFILNKIVFPDMGWVEVWGNLAGKLGNIEWPQALFRHFDMVIIPMLIAGQIYFMGRAQRLERLTLTLDGIRYTSPLPGALKWLKPDWFLPWNQVSKVEMGKLNGRMLNPAFVLMTFVSVSGQKRIQPYLWVKPDEYPKPGSWFAFRPVSMHQSSDEIIKAVTESEVARYISRNVPHIALDTSFPRTEVQTSLEKNPHGRIAIAIIFLLIIYAVADVIAGPESYLGAAAEHADIFIVSGVIGAVLSAIWLYKSTLLAGEKAGLALMIGILVSVAMYPGALRINAITGSMEPVAYGYHVVKGTEGVVLYPVDNDMPVIDDFAHKKFWDKFAKDDVYQINIRKGGLGFYQFNSSLIVDEIREADSK